MSFIRGGTRFPLTAETTQPLAVDADPNLVATLRYLKSCLLYNCQDRWQAELTKGGWSLPESDGSVVSDSIPYNLEPWANAENYVFPILNLYRTQQDVFSKTLATSNNRASWTLNYVLPPLDPEQARSLLPILPAIANVIAGVLENGSDAGFYDGAAWMDATSLIGLQAKQATFGFAEFSNGTCPAITFAIEVEEEETTDPDSEATLEGFDLDLQIADEDD